MLKTFRPHEPDQMLLMPSSLADWVPEDHLARFVRKRHSAALASLFTQRLRRCRRAGLVKLGQVAIDGTRVKTNASKHKVMSCGRMTEQESAPSRGRLPGPARRRNPDSRPPSAHSPASRAVRRSVTRTDS